MATQKITMGRNRDTDFESKKAAALAQADAINSYMWGMQQVETFGPGYEAKMSRSPQYGNPNMVTGDILDGQVGNFKPSTDSAGNSVISDPYNQTGYLAGGVSSTVEPQTDPTSMNQNAMARIAMMQQGGQFQGLNNRQQVYGA
jgi:hypothetical protein